MWTWTKANTIMKLFSLLLAGLLALSATLRAQTVDDLMVTTALSTTGTDGARWVYVTWDSGNAALFNKRAFSISVKPGAAATPGTYVRQAVVRRAPDAKLIVSLLTRAACLGENLTQLDMMVSDTLAAYPGAMPATREARLAALLARAEPEVADQLLPILRRVSPGAAMSLGQAWAGAVNAAPGQQVTVEIREYDDATQTDRGVVGRTTVTVATHTPLPATGAPWQVPDLAATGDLNIRLRWPLPDALLRRQMQLMGYSVWRAPKAFAESQGWHTTPPAYAALSGAAAQGVWRLNAVPIRESKVFGAANVADTVADPETYFIGDDNDRYTPGGAPFADGDQFYYFTVPHDLLNRPGVVSAAGAALACRNIPPPAPRDLAITERTTGGTGAGAGRQSLVLTWRQNVNAGTGHTDEYQVLTASSSEAFAEGAPPLTPIATLAHTGAETLSYEDTAAYPEDVTQWFVVRAVHHGARGDLISTRAAPVPAVRRNLSPATAPAPADTFIGGFCPRCVLTPVTQSTIPTPPGTPQWTVRVQVTRQSSDVAWVDVQDNLLAADKTTRVYFTEGSAVLTHEWTTTEFSGRPLFDITLQAAGMEGTRSLAQTVKTGATGSSSTVLVLSCNAALLDAGQVRSTNPLATPLLGGALALSSASAALGGTGVVSAAFSGTALPDGADVLVQQGGADVGIGKVWRQRVVFTGAPGGGYIARSIAVTDPAAHARGFHGGRTLGGPKLNGLLTGFYPPANTREFRLYRQVDLGGLTLVRQGELTDTLAGGSGAGMVALHDFGLPPNAACMGYFVQMLDKSGNGSPLVRLGTCTQITAPLPVPTLGQPGFTGTPAAPKVELHWTCPPEGVEHFEIYLQPKTGMPLADIPPGSAWLSTEPVTSAPPIRSYAAAGVAHVITSPRDSASGRATGRRMTASAFLSPRLGSGATALGTGPVFSMEFGITPGVEYDAWIAAVGPGTSTHGTRGEFSDLITFRYLPPPPPDPNCVVPWPFRDLPPTVVFHPGIRAQRFVPVAGESASNVMGEWPVWPLDHDSAPVGVKIGAITVEKGGRPGGNVFGAGTPGDPSDDALYLTPSFLAQPERSDLNHAIYAAAATSAQAGQRILPAVLYRQQVVSALFPEVSDHVVQCSPLITRLALESVAASDLRLRDPFIGVTGVNITSATNFAPLVSPTVSTATLYLHLLDTKPVLSGARYQYWLVRFQSNGEPAETVDAGQVDVP